MSKPVGPYTPAIKAGDILFCSGQIGQIDGVVVDGFDKQANVAFDNLETVLADHKATLSDVVKATVFLVDMGKYAEMNETYLARFGDHRPARSCIAVAALPLGAEFEIEVVAHVR